jgi:hypothetical protein
MLVNTPEDGFDKLRSLSERFDENIFVYFILILGFVIS